VALLKPKANVPENEANLKQARIDQESAMRRLAVLKSIPQADYRAELLLSNIASGSDLEATQLNAPISGRVHFRVAQGDLVRDDVEIATIVRPGSAYVDFEVPLRLLPLLGEARDGVGMPVAIRIASEKAAPRSGTVGLTGARIDADKGVLRLRAVLPNDGIVSGQPARVRLKTGKPYQALLAPQGALVDAVVGSYLHVLNDKNAVERRPVQLGPTQDGLLVVKSGLEPTDWVVLGGPPGIKPGMVLQPRQVTLLGEAIKQPSNAAHAKTVFLQDKGLLMTLPLQFASAAEAIKVVRQVYREHTAPRGRLALTVDDKANTLTVEGPTDQVLEVVKLIGGLEELGRQNPKSATVPDYAAQYYNYTKYLNVKRSSYLHETTPGPRLGVSVEPVGAALADQLNLPRDTGLVVVLVAPQSPAAKIGVEKNDVLLQIAGAQVPADVGDFMNLIASLKSDTPLALVVLRKGQKRNLGNVRLGETLTPASKQSADTDAKQVENLKARVSTLEADMAALKDRAAWSERMKGKGYVTEQEVQADRARLQKAQSDLNNALRDLRKLAPDPKAKSDQGRKP
jgi:RND family efflux transporter MFP subunit